MCAKSLFQECGNCVLKSKVCCFSLRALDSNTLRLAPLLQASCALQSRLYVLTAPSTAQEQISAPKSNQETWIHSPHESSWHLPLKERRWQCSNCPRREELDGRSDAEQIARTHGEERRAGFSLLPDSFPSLPFPPH